MATLWKTDGTSQVVTPQHGSEFTLKELQAFVGGYIEIVRLDEQSIMIVNEDGHAMGLALNNMGTQLYAGQQTGFPVVGDVLVCSAKEVT
jgi:hypothetical protein